jgi:MFS family permease
VLLASEFGDERRRGLRTGWPQVGVPAGNLLAAGVLAAMAGLQSNRDFLAWGWRVPFLLSAALVAVGWWVRSRIDETPVFESAVIKAAQKSAAPALEALRARPGGVAIGAGLKFGENISYYIITAVSITYATEVAHISRAAALNALLAGAVAECATMPLFSALCDRIGRRWVYAIGAGGMAIWAFAFFRLLDTGATWPVIAAMVVGLILHGAMYGPQAAFIAELFPTRFRYSGASIAYQLTSVFAGSLAPIIALWLLRLTGSTTPISVYVAGACAISLFAALRARETRADSFAVIDGR